MKCSNENDISSKLFSSLELLMDSCGTEDTLRKNFFDILNCKTLGDYRELGLKPDDVMECIRAIPDLISDAESNLDVCTDMCTFLEHQPTLRRKKVIF